MGHNRKLVLGGASLTAARVNRHTIAAGTEVRDELEAVMLSTAYLDHAPFMWVGLMLRFGLTNEDAPHYEGIDEKDGELAVAIELDTHDLQGASRELLKELFMIATLKTLVHVGKKYQLPYESFATMLSDLQTTRAARLATHTEFA